MNKFLITEEEKNRILNLHRLRSKNQYLIFESDEEVDVENFVPKTRAEVMALQQAILDTEGSEEKIKFENEDDKSASRLIRRLKQGRSSVVKFSGSSLCDGFCTVFKAVDGIYGPRTKKAFEYHKSNSEFKKNLKSELSNVEEKYGSSVNDWRIPASKESIKSFQYFIWKIIEHDLPKVDRSCDKPNCEFKKSILCGENACKVDKAVDGFWGPNTKKAWNEYKDKYLTNYEINNVYDENKTDSSVDNSEFVAMRKKYNTNPEDEKETDDNKEKETDVLK
jgi:hypothetical protein